MKKLQATKLQEDVAKIVGGHQDTITWLSYDPVHKVLMSIGMDSNVHIWQHDAIDTPFESTELWQPRTTLKGAPHGFDKNLIKGSLKNNTLTSRSNGTNAMLVASGSSDRTAVIWQLDNISKDNTSHISDANPPTAYIKYKLPGHQGTVNQVDFHPTQPILLSCSTDKSLILGEF